MKLAPTITLFLGLLVATTFAMVQSTHANPHDEAKAAPISTLEGVLKVHPKFLYKYYVAIDGGQQCALYDTGHVGEPEQLEGIEPGTRIRVKGKLGSYLHAGGTEDNPSPFSRTWVIYMDVEEVDVLDHQPDTTQKVGQIIDLPFRRHLIGRS